MQSEETEGANSELFKENVDDTMYKNPYKIWFCDLISVFLVFQLIEEVSVIPLLGNLLQCAILGEFFESRFDLISQLLFILVHDDDSLIDFEWKELQQQRWQQISEMFSWCIPPWVHDIRKTWLRLALWLLTAIMTSYKTDERQETKCRWRAGSLPDPISIHRVLLRSACPFFLILSLPNKKLPSHKGREP